MLSVKETLRNMTLEEKVLLVTGTGFMCTNPLPRLSVPSLRFSDGPHGLRAQTNPEKVLKGLEGNLPATCFPTAAAVASSWNTENARLIGDAIAGEALYYGTNIVLGPGLNVKRNPLCGRNFEYYSEDPLLSGKMGAAMIGGMEAGNAGSCVKHFALNNGENFRFVGNSAADPRAVREIYLKPFEIAVKEGGPRSVMCAYNKVNGTFCSENRWLLTDVLRKDWGFEGIVMTDWGAVSDKVAAIRSGDDIDMPGDTAVCRRQLYDAVRSGSLDEKILDISVERILKTVKSFEGVSRPEDPGFEAHHSLAADIGADCAVLMKNDGALPFNKNEKILVTGDLFRNMRYQGSGSSMITPAFLTTPEEAFRNHGASWDFAPGYIETENKTDPELLGSALEKAKDYDSVTVFAGLTDDTESESADRDNMLLPENQLALIQGLLEAGKKITLVLFGGSPVELPFADRLSAILNMYLPGQNGGEAVYRLLFGEVSPGGRLAETWPAAYDDVPFGKEFSRYPTEIYRESIFVGYRYYGKYGKKVRFPFGFGLSYTSFSYSGLQVKTEEGLVKVSCTVSNTGSREGSEVVQLYVSKPDSAVLRPLRELKAFKKVYLDKGASAAVTLTVPPDELRYYDARQGRFLLEGGAYSFQLCRDAETVIDEAVISVESEDVPSPCPEPVLKAFGGSDIAPMTNEDYGNIFGVPVPEDPPLLPLTTESRIHDFRETVFGRIFLFFARSYFKLLYKKAGLIKDPARRSIKRKEALFMLSSLETNSMRSLSMVSAGVLPFNVAEGVVHLANGHPVKGLRSMVKKIKDPCKNLLRRNS